MLIQIVSWPRFSISGEDFSLANFIFLMIMIRLKPKSCQRIWRRPSWSCLWWLLSHNLKLTCKDWDCDTSLWLVHLWTLWRKRSGSRSPTSSWAMLNPCQSKTSSGKFARCKSATLLSTRLRLNHFWPNCYSAIQIGGRSFEGVGWIPALFSGSVAMAQSNIPRSPIHAQFCNTEHREPGQDQAQLGHRQGGCQGLVFNLRPAQHLPAESTPSKEGWHLVSIMVRCYDLCFTCSHQECWQVHGLDSAAAIWQRCKYESANFCTAQGHGWHPG